jgi:hypothetical protein
MTRLNQTQDVIAQLADATQDGAMLGSGYASNEAMAPTTWGRVNFTREDGCAQISIDRHLHGDEAVEFEKMVREFFAVREAKVREMKERAYGEARDAQLRALASSQRLRAEGKIA